MAIFHLVERGYKVLNLIARKSLPLAKSKKQLNLVVVSKAIGVIPILQHLCTF